MIQLCAGVVMPSTRSPNVFWVVFGQKNIKNANMSSIRGKVCYE